MIFDYSLAAFVTVGLLIYLVYALLRPEQLKLEKAHHHDPHRLDSDRCSIARSSSRSCRRSAAT